MRQTMNYEFHHIGIPTNETKKGERYSSTFKMYTSGGEPPLRIQYHRFEEGSPLHPLLKNKTHIAFKVENLEAAIQGKTVLLQPYEPFKGFRVAIIQEGEAVIELIETTLSEEQIWDDSQHKDSVIYPTE